MLKFLTKTALKIISVCDASNMWYTSGTELLQIKPKEGIEKFF